MRLDRRKAALVLVALLLATLFVRLGVWQLDRHGERREANRERRQRLAMPALSASGPAELAAFPPTESLAWRRVRLRGRWDVEREILLGPRSHGGRPAVELLTPLLLAPDTAVLVLRGWLPSPDGLHAPVGTARPAEAPAVVAGLAVVPPRPEDREPDPSAARRLVVDGEERLALRRVDLETASYHLPYIIASFYVHLTEQDPDIGALRPLPDPDPGPGPHLSYAIQWFAFALIALVGTGILLARGG